MVERLDRILIKQDEVAHAQQVCSRVWENIVLIKNLTALSQAEKRGKVRFNFKLSSMLTVLLTGEGLRVSSEGVVKYYKAVPTKTDGNCNHGFQHLGNLEDLGLVNALWVRGHRRVFEEFASLSKKQISRRIKAYSQTSDGLISILQCDLRIKLGDLFG